MLAADSPWVRAPFLVDTGADGTVLSAVILRLLGLPLETSSERIGGLRGLASSVSISTSIRLTRNEGRLVLFRGQFPALTDLEALDICILGRDIMGLFTVIVDQPSNVVCLIRERHRYRIEET